MSDRELQIEKMSNYNNVKIDYFKDDDTSDDENVKITDGTLGMNLLANPQKLNYKNNNENDFNNIDINDFERKKLNTNMNNILNNNDSDSDHINIIRSNNSSRKNSRKSKKNSRSSLNSIPIESSENKFEQKQFGFNTKTLDEILKEKQELLYEIERLKKRGAQFSKEYNISSNLEDMKLEISRVKNIRDNENGIKLCRKILMCCCSGIEWVNNRWDPFNIQLDGWSESLHDDISSYDEVFEELYQKYKTEGTIAPELKLVFMIVSSAVMYHITHSMFKSSMPQFENIMRNTNSEPAPNVSQNRAQKSQTKQAGFNPMDLIGSAMPGLSNFMGMMQGNNSNNNMGGAPIEIEESVDFNSPVKKPTTVMKEPELAGIESLLDDLSEVTKSTTTNKKGKTVLNLN